MAVRPTVAMGVATHRKRTAPTGDWNQPGSRQAVSCTTRARAENNRDEHLDPKHHPEHYPGNARSELETIKLPPRADHPGIRNCRRCLMCSTTELTVATSPQLIKGVCGGLAPNWEGRPCLPSKQPRAGARYRQLPDTHYPDRRQMASRFSPFSLEMSLSRRTKPHPHCRTSLCWNLQHTGREELSLGLGWEYGACGD